MYLTYIIYVIFSVLNTKTSISSLSSMASSYNMGGSKDVIPPAPGMYQYHRHRVGWCAKCVKSLNSSKTLVTFFDRPSLYFVFITGATEKGYYLIFFNHFLNAQILKDIVLYFFQYIGHGTTQ